MSSRIFQSVIIQMKDATKRSIGVIDPEGSVIASSNLSLIGTTIKPVQILLEDGVDIVSKGNGRSFKPLLTATGNEYHIFSDGEDETARTLCVMASIAISEAGVYFEENNDKRAFVKNIVLENILPGDIYVRAKELRFPLDVTRGVIVVRHGIAKDISIVEILQEMFTDRQKEFVFSVSDKDAVLVKEIVASGNIVLLREIAEKIEARIDDVLGIKPIIGVGTPALHLRELADRYKEALISIDVGKVFDVNKSIICYENLGIGRLIYQLPITLCEIFLSEVFKRNPIEALDQETLFTIDKFFENNLNVSETSRKLFVHRNTLVYRLEKIKKITGLDLREFDHAIVFRVALMVKKYLVSQETKS